MTKTLKIKMLNENQEKMKAPETTLTAKYANFIGWSDVEPYEILRFISDTKIEVRKMKTTLLEPAKVLGVGGFSAIHDNHSQRWSIEPDPTAEPGVLRKHKNGKWYAPTGARFTLSDKPCKFYDYNF